MIDRQPNNFKPRTQDSPMRGSISVDEYTRLRAYAVSKAKTMTLDLVGMNGNVVPERAGLYVDHYHALCKAVGLDTTLVVCQTWHETGRWESTWFKAPRRNPAGIGVNGKTSPVWLPGYQKLPSGKWGKGVAYDTYYVAALAHVWGVAMWCGLDTSPIRDERYVNKMYNPPKSARGSVTTVKQLGWEHNPHKIGWAHPGSSYGYAIAKLANEVTK